MKAIGSIPFDAIILIFKTERSAMEIYTEQWQRLCDAITTVTATSRGLQLQANEAEQRRNVAVRELAHFEEWAMKTPIAPPHVRVPPGSELQGPLTADTVAGREQHLAEARAEVERLMAEYQRLNAAGDQVFARLTKLKRLQARCYAWADERGIQLPGERPSGMRVIPQSTPSGRPFGAYGGVGTPSQAGGEAPPASAGGLPASALDSFTSSIGQFARRMFS